MDLNSYQKFVAEMSLHVNPPLCGEISWYHTIALTGELGEFLAEYYDENRKDMLLEIGDVNYYLMSFINTLKLNQTDYYPLPDEIETVEKAKPLVLLICRLNEVVKKIIRDNKGALGDREEELLELIGNIARVVCGLIVGMGSSLDEVIELNVAKINKRRANGKAKIG